MFGGSGADASSDLFIVELGRYNVVSAITIMIIALVLPGAHNESSVVRRQERYTPTHLIKISNLHMMDVHDTKDRLDDG